MISTNVATDIDFQRIFNGFYIVRRNEDWRKCYYEHFESIKNGSPTFESIIAYLYECTGNIEPSFSSKMLATIFSEKPIWKNGMQIFWIQSKVKNVSENLTECCLIITEYPILRKSTVFFGV